MLRMVLLVDLPPIGGVVVWLITRPDDPGVLTIAASREVANDVGVPDITPPTPPEGEQEAWTLDLDAVRERLDPHSSPYFPAWASGRISVAPSEVGARVVRFVIRPEMIGQALRRFRKLHKPPTPDNTDRYERG
jgi:hypothetical protein